MPDWILHMGATHALARPLPRLDPRWLLLGAVLPDVVPRLFSFTVLLVPPLQELSTLRVALHVGFFHTPVAVALLVLALAAVAAAPGRAAVGLALGAGLHFAFDVCQRTWGGGSSLLFPFDLTPMSLQLAWYDSAWVPGAVGVAGVYLAVVLWRSRPWPDDPPFCFRARRVVLGLVSATAFLLLPATVVDRAVELGLQNAKITTAPDELEGQPIRVSVTTIEEVDGDVAVIDRADRLVDVLWRGTPRLAPGDFVSIQGVYRDGRIEAQQVFVHDYPFKMVVSLLGGVALVLVWWPSLRRLARRRPGATLRA